MRETEKCEGMNQLRTEYLSDRELEQLMGEAARGSLAPPQYLEQRIIEKSRQQSRSLRRKKTLSAKRQLFAYSMKVAVVTAASLALLVLIPMVEESSRMTPEQLQDYRSQLQQEATKEWESQREDEKKQQDQDGFLNWLNDTTGNFCSKLNEKTTAIFK
ncbi:MAG: hypothetical protein ACI4DO_03995 [Roseburia sp.]